MSEIHQRMPVGVREIHSISCGKLLPVGMAVPEALQETTVDGPRTRRWVLEAKECAELGSHRLARLGLDEARPPYSRVRLQPQGSFVMACVGGSGRVLLDGRWQRVRAGTVCMAPPRVLNAFRAEGGEPWRFAWLRYEEPPFVAPLVGASSPVLIGQGAGEIARVVEGLRGEWTGARDPRMIHHWVELLHGAARRMARPFHRNERLARLWLAVEADLAAAWTVEGLARHFHASGEHLRRLCQRELGRSPMQQVTSMRMQLARHLLESTDDKLEVVAARVGYGNAFVFSKAFKRWVGCAPAEYRGRRPAGGDGRGGTV